jgi:hypothetical protein
MTANIPPRPVDLIRAQCPGPVTLHVPLRKRLVALVLALCATALMAYVWLVDTGPQYRSYDWFMLPFTVVVFLAVTIRAAILMLAPRAACLTLDVDGFEVCGVFICRRTSWREARDFHVEKAGRDGHPIVMYDVVTDDGTKMPKLLPETYGLSEEDLAWLLEQWQRDALAHQNLPQNALRQVDP